MNKFKFVYAIFVMAVITIAIFSCLPHSIPSVPNSMRQGLIRGYVFTNVTFPPPEHGAATHLATKQIYIPDVTITVLDNSNNQVDQFKTDLSGGYQSKLLNYGNYKIRLEKQGFNTSVHDVTVSKYANHPAPVEISLSHYIFGNVRMRDGLPGFYSNEVFNYYLHTDIQASLNGTSINQVSCNINGDYVIPIQNLNNHYTLTARCQNSSVSQVATSSLVNLVLPNNSPKIRAITAFNSANRSVLRTTPGSRITLRADAVDEDRHSLSYKWVPSGNFPGSSFGTGNTATWQLPNQAGTYQVFLLVYDQFGGVAYKPFTITAGDENVHFSGTVSDANSSQPVGNASIRVNGQFLGITSSNGFFSVAIPQGTGRRYTLNIEKQGYMLHSTIYFNDATEKAYGLIKSTTKVFDPSTDITLTEEEDEYTRFINRQQVIRRAAIVKIPKNSIVDSSGNQVTENVFVSIRNIDLFDPRVDAMPGDYGAVQRGAQKVLDSYGAIDIQIRSQSDPTKKYRLKNGANAQISIPIASRISSTAPASAILWDYDEVEGVWRDIGNLNKVGEYFVGQTDHFSTLNTDVAKNDATCIQLLDNPANPLNPGQLVNVTVTIPTTTSVPKVKSYKNLSTNDLPLIIVRLPPNSNVTIDVSTTSGSVISNQVVPTRSAIPGPANLNPDPPYTYCNDAYLKPPPGLGTPTTAAFLNFVTTPDENTAWKYYFLIGAIGGDDYNGDGITDDKDTINFDLWKQRNRFDSGDDINAVYYNAGDLAFGRGMHQKSNGSYYSAYYVSNFTRDFDAIADMASPNPNAIATVAMEFSPIISGNQATKFYVFNASGKLLPAADLDGYGPKFIPGLCIDCHGGENVNFNNFANYDLANYYDNHPESLPRFLPFDVASFRFSNQPGFTQSDMESNIRLLNQSVLTTYETDAIRDFVLAAYNDTNTPLNAVNFNRSAVVSGWNSGTLINGINPRDFYTQVVGTSCRTCHIARSDEDLWFDSSTKFSNSKSFIQGLACTSSGKSMPNSKVTFVNFWTGTTSYGVSRPELLGRFLQLNCN